MKILDSPYFRFFQRKARTSALLATILLSLIGIPVLLHYGHTKSARVTGLILLLAVITGVYLLKTRNLRQFRSKILVRLDRNDIFWLEKFIPFYKNLDKKDRNVFNSRVRLFLGEISVTEVDKETPDRSTCLYVASAAVIAFWGLPYWNYGELSEVLVYPQNFNMDNQLNQRGLISGKVHHGGLLDSTMILSLPALKHGFKNDKDKQNVGVHEFAHLLDKETGSIDGVPFFLNPAESQLWLELVDREIRKIKTRHSDIHMYAGTDKAEFFAVIMEYFRESPEILEKKHPELYKLLSEHLNPSEVQEVI